MMVLGLGVLDQAERSFPYARSSIRRWKTITEGAKWKHFPDVKQHFSADLVGKCVVFDIKHNAFRLIAIVDFVRSIVLVKAFITHAEYSKDRWKDECGCD